MSSNLTPLEVCEHLIAPISKLGTIAGMKEKAAYGWRRASEWRDAGDMPPRVNRRLLKFAKHRGIPLTATHLIFGASRAEVDALLDEMRQAARDKTSKLAAE
tara:strand:+ start:2151 stop:2456 length:306 start_codon:yes stop_codon:yes gene_type:complete